MAKRSKKTSSRSKATSQGLAKLRKAGLIGRSEFRGKPSGNAYKLLRKYRDVVTGQAVVVNPNTRLIPRQLRKAYKERRGKLVIPKPAGTIATTVTRGKSGIEIKRTRRGARGALVRELVTTGNQDIPPLPKGKFYRVRMMGWGRERSRYFKTQAALTEFFQYYDDLQQWLDIAISEPEAWMLPDAPFGDSRESIRRGR